MALKFDLGDLQAFRSVCELGSFRAAANALHLSQPGLWPRVEKLGEALKVKLLDRTTRRVNLAAIGRDFSRKSQNLLDDLDDMLLGVAAKVLAHVDVRRADRDVVVHNASSPFVDACHQRRGGRRVPPGRGASPAVRA